MLQKWYNGLVMNLIFQIGVKIFEMGQIPASFLLFFTGQVPKDKKVIQRFVSMQKITKKRLGMIHQKSEFNFLFYPEKAKGFYMY